MKTLCLYVFHQYTLNVQFFIKHGLFQDPTVDFILIANDPDFKMVLPCPVVVRKNENYDFGAWSEVLLTSDKYKQYDYFILINSTVRGPFLPPWFRQKNWTKLFTEQITDQVKLFGTMICIFDGRPHVQSMLLTTDRIGLQIGINQGIFQLGQTPLTKGEISANKEIQYSTEILNAGYNIGCLLRAYQGIDFRKSSFHHQTICLFELFSYYGMAIHPYEVIFPKITGDAHQSGHQQYMIDKYTSWEMNSEIPLPIPSFDWIQYTLQHPDPSKIFNRATAWSQYTISGGNLTVQDKIKFYQIDLNPWRTSGLFNQLWSLINGILLAHLLTRNVVVSSFYPSHQKNDQLPLDQIVDIQYLNCLIAELGLRTHLTMKVDGVRWQNSKYLNPTKDVYDKNGFLKMLTLMNQEEYRYLNLNDTFNFNLFYRHEDPELRDIFTKLLTGIRFAPKIQQIVQDLKKQYQLTTSYQVIHLRLEDDWIHDFYHRPNRSVGQNRYQRYLALIRQHLKPDHPVYLCTYLTKSPNIMNFTVGELKKQYPKTILAEGWRTRYPHLSPGREIDALVDYLISRDGEIFIGMEMSTFSLGLDLGYKNRQKPSYLVSF